MLPPKRFKQNTTKATEIKRNGTEAIGIDQDGIAKSIDIEVLMTKDNVGLGDVDNTSDADKPVSTAQQAALNNKESVANVDILKGAGWTDENLVDHETRIQMLEGFVPSDSWADMQKIVRAGLADKLFVVGDQIEDANGKVWTVIGINHDKSRYDADAPTLTLQADDILMNGQFSAPQAMYNAETALSAGTHIFTTNSLQYTVTTTQTIPAGGVMYIATRSDYVPLTITTYGADRKTAIETGLAVTPTTGTDTLTTINDHVRCRYGSNEYAKSAVRQFLNSEDVAFVWTPQGLYDMPSTFSGTGGFLKQIDPELVAVLGQVDKQVAQATYDGGGQDTFSDTIFLLSRVEMGYGTEGVTTGEVVYPFWDGATNAERIKGSPSYWWLRSPIVGNTYDSRNVSTTGGLNYYYAYNTFGLSPACVII